MALLANLRERVRGNVPTIIKRTLLGEGKIVVAKGQEVTPDFILGTSEVRGGFFTIKLAEKLGVGASEADKYLVRPVGANIFKGELLAKKAGFFGTTYVTASTDGVIESYNKDSGEVKLIYSPRNTPLTAGVFGIVENVNHLSGEVLIKCFVTEIMGVYGCGLERGGPIVILDHGTNIIRKEQLTKSLEGRVLVGGAIIYGETLKKAVEIGLAGIISGGFNARDFRAMSGNLDPMYKIGNDPGVSVLGTEGFGPTPIGEDIYSVLKEFQGKYGFIKGNFNCLQLPSSDPDSIMRLRKVTLSLSNWSESLSNIKVEELIVGQKVRIIWPPFAGWQGTIEAIDRSVTKLPSGLGTYLLTVQTSLKKIKVPYPNVELVA